MRLVAAVDPGLPDLRSPDHFLWWLGRQQWPNLAAGAWYGVLWMGSLAGLPLVLGRAVGSAANRQPATVLAWSLGILLLGTFAAVAGVMRHRRAVTNYLLSASRTQQLIIRCATRLGAELPRQVAAGEVASLSATDVDRIGSTFDVTGRFAGAVVTYLGVTGLLFAMAPEFGLVALIGGPLTLVSLVACLGPLGRRQQAQREAVAVASGQAVDVVVGLRVLRGLGGETMFANRFAIAATTIRDAMNRTAQMAAVLTALEALVPGSFLVAVTWLGARMAASGRAGAGELVTVYALAAFLLVPLATFGEAAQSLSAGRVAARKVLSVLVRQRELVEPSGEPNLVLPTPQELARGVLEDSRTGTRVEPGILVAITSADSEGLIELAARLGRYADPGDGAWVTLGGRRLDSLPLELVRQTILVVDRDATLLAGSLQDNLDPLVEAGENPRPELDQVLRAAQAIEILSGLEGGLSHLLPERGRSLSGGQRQRLVLARALRSGAPILVLEEPTSAVDAYTELMVVEGLRQLRSGLTTVVLTTSPMLMERADQVLVLDQRVVASGSHRQLLQTEPRYRTLLERELAG
ncbi:MAG TPA: ABC transporter ATP-binding protein [Candidatus Dormibacteraeota bacterium]|nr:ABC transporter ATP-binding protein [Candidatus Dormibacteraeota bacterium]